jgi:replication factor C small subunit
MKLVWSETYRPKTINEIVGQEDIKKELSELIKKPLEMPHFLFVGRSPGTGKTTFAHAIKNEIKCPSSDIMVLNSSDERKLETIRDKVKDFVITQKLKMDTPRLVIMDEFDGMLSASQDALRFLMEKYSSNCKFLLTANDETKIIEPILSRCKVFRVTELPKEKILERLKFICESESVVYEVPALKKIIDIYYPDMRSMINELQSLASIGINEQYVKTRTELADQFYDLLKTGNPHDTRRFVIENSLDPTELLKRTLENMLKDSDSYNPESFWELAEADYRIRTGADPEIQLFAFILRFIKK